MAALISSVMDTKDKVPFFVNRTEQMGIEILPPDVNLSDHEFVVVEGNIRFGLDAVKGVGYQAVEAMKAAREEGGPFESLWDFCARVDSRAVNKKAIEALIKCGAFGSTGASRKGMLGVLEQAQGAGQQAQQDLAIGQGSIFDLAAEAPANGAAAAFAAPSHPPIPAEEFEQHELLAAEKESIGLFISAHPLKEVREALLEKVDAPLAELGRFKDGDWARSAGSSRSARRSGPAAARRWPSPRSTTSRARSRSCSSRRRWPSTRPCSPSTRSSSSAARIDHKDKDKTCLVVQSAEQFRPSAAQVEAAREAAALVATGPEPVKVMLDASQFAATIIDRLKHVFECFPGDSEVVLDIRTADGPRTLRLGPSYRVAPTPSLRAELASILGPAALQPVPQAA